MTKYKFKQVDIRLKLSQAKPLYSTEQITTAQKAIEVMAEYLVQMDREYCCVINMDAANHPINFNIVSIGDTNHAPVPIQNLFKSAILSNASSILILHNHTGGSLTPSTFDVDMTLKMVKAGRLMNIPVLDHVIVAGSTYDRCFSFKEQEPDLWNERIYP